MIENKKQYGPEDPMERVSVYLDIPDQDTHFEAMARTFVEEYMMMGLSDKEIFHLFENPFYNATYQIYTCKGKDYVHTLIKEVRDGQS